MQSGEIPQLGHLFAVGGDPNFPDEGILVVEWGSCLKRTAPTATHCFGLDLGKGRAVRYGPI